MTEAQQFDSSEDSRKEDERADARAALVIVVVAVLSAIHFVYTGGLPAFFAQVL
jgi:hypothetical protein